VADRSFGPTVLAGLGGAALAAVAASRTWTEVSGTAAGVRVTAEVTGSEAAPLALALSLVALAAWGVVLVLRGAVRRVLAVVAAAAAAGVVWTVVSSGQPLRSAAGDAVLAAGGTGGGVTTDHTAWVVTTGLAAAVATLAALVAVRRAPSWPEMGSRYDAPTAAGSGAGAAAAGRAGDGPPPDDRDLWKALDEGHDPTA
jgi:uncharacterized membrane protein (TIGR02234 family)